MDDVAEGSSTDGHALAVRASGRLSLPHISTPALPNSSRTAYLAVGVLMQYIMTLQPEASSASADTHLQGKSTVQLGLFTLPATGSKDVMEQAACRLRVCIGFLAEPENGDADSAGPQDDARDLAGLELDVRERIYDMVRPLDWMEEAPEPPGADSALRFRCLIAAHQDRSVTLSQVDVPRTMGSPCVRQLHRPQLHRPQVACYFGGDSAFQQCQYGQITAMGSRDCLLVCTRSQEAHNVHCTPCRLGMHHARVSAESPGVDGVKGSMRCSA